MEVSRMTQLESLFQSRTSRRQMIKGLAGLGIAAPSLAAILEACSSSSTSGTGGVPSKDLKATISVWGFKNTTDALKLNDADFKVAYPNITVSYSQGGSGDYYQNVQLAISAGSGGPDVVWLEDSHIEQYIKIGAMADMTAWVQPYVNQVIPYKWEFLTKSGKYYAMPMDAGPVAVFYRRDVFKQAGVDPTTINTWDDFYQAAKTIKQKTGSTIWQQSKARNDGRLFETLMWQQGTGYVDSSGNVALDKDPKVQQVLEYMGKMWTDGLAADNEAWTDPWYKAMATGGSATVVEAVWMGNFFKSFIAPQAGGNWGVIKMPAWSSGGVQTANDGGASVGILQQSSNKDAAWAYIQFHLARTQSQLSMYAQTDLFPTLEPSYQDAFFEEADPYYGGQDVRSFFADAAKHIPTAGVYSSDYAQMASLTTPEIQKYALGQQTAQQALSNAANLIRQRTNRS